MPPKIDWSTNVDPHQGTFLKSHPPIVCEYCGNADLFMLALRPNELCCEWSPPLA